MPRIKPSKAPQQFATRYQLREPTQRVLRELGFTPHDLVDIAKALGLYVDGRHAIDHQPGCADFRAAYQPIMKRARQVVELLSAVPEPYRSRLEAEKFSFETFEKQQLRFIDKCERAISQAPKQKGRRPQTALLETIRLLRLCFWRREGGHPGGAVESAPRQRFMPRPEQEKREASFVQIALDDANIDYGDIYLLLRDPRCALAAERAIVADEIERRRFKSLPQ